MSSLLASFGAVLPDVVIELSAARIKGQEDEYKDWNSHDQPRHDLVGHEERGNTTNSSQDAHHWGNERVSVHLGVLVDTLIEPRFFVHAIDVVSQGVSPLPILDCWSHQEPKAERRRKCHTNSRPFATTQRQWQLKHKCSNCKAFGLDVRACRLELQVEVFNLVACFPVQLALQIPVDGWSCKHVVFHVFLDGAAREDRVGVVEIALEDLQNSTLLL